MCASPALLPSLLLLFSKISGDGLTRTRSGDRPTIAPRGVLLQQGRWYYEVEIITSGRATIGWGDRSFGSGRSSQSSLFAVGADAHSWGVSTFDCCIRHDANSGGEIGSPRRGGAHRKTLAAATAEGGVRDGDGGDGALALTRSSSEVFGGWSAGSVVGCLLEIDAVTGEAQMTWMLDGSIDAVDASNPSASVTVDAAPRGRSRSAFSRGRGARRARAGAGGFVPAVSFESSFQFRINFGDQPFRFAPPARARSICHFVRRCVAEECLLSPLLRARALAESLLAPTAL